MKENDILSEIHRVREEIARECGYDVKEIFRRMRARTEQLKAEGWQGRLSGAPRKGNRLLSARRTAQTEVRTTP